MDLLHKLRAIESRLAMFEDAAATPGLTVIEGVLGPCEVVVQGRPTLMFGSNNYLGLTKHSDVVDAARRALDDYGTGTTGSRTANGTFALHEALERDFAEWFGKRHAIIFSTGYQANLSLIGGLCGAGDVIVLDRVDFIVGTFSKSLAGIGGVCVSDHPELRALHFLARAYVFTASGSPSNVASVAAAVRVIRQHPELRERLWTNIRALRRGLRDVGYAIGESESPIVPILIGDEERTIALWQGLLTAGLYVNLIVPPGCPKDDCVLRASCSAAHTPDQIDRALEIFARARSRSAESLALQRGHTVAPAF